MQSQQADNNRLGFPAQDAVLDGPVLTWTIHLAKEMPAKLCLVIIGYGAAMLAWWYFLPVPAALLLPLVALTSAMSEFLFPVTYTIDDVGISQKCLPFFNRHIAWTDVRRASAGRDGFFVTTLRLPSRLDQFRGIRINPRGNDAAVRAVITKRMELMREGLAT
ncbi:MAG: hypothetical protein ACOYLC_03715 [Armatimonadaceae bacterium]